MGPVNQARPGSGYSATQIRTLGSTSGMSTPWSSQSCSRYIETTLVRLTDSIVWRWDVALQFQMHGLPLKIGSAWLVHCWPCARPMRTLHGRSITRMTRCHIGLGSMCSARSWLKRACAKKGMERLARLQGAGLLLVAYPWTFQTMRRSSTSPTGASAGMCLPTCILILILIMLIHTL